MEFYPWVVVAHVFFVIVAFGAHGASAFAMFRVRSETDRNRLAATLDVSTAALNTAAIGLVLAVLTGILAAYMAGHFGRAWPWVSIAVVVVVWIGMTPLAANPMREVRRALGLPTDRDKKGEPPPKPASDEGLALARARVRPELPTALGLIGIAVLVWLMELKPF